MLIGITGTNGAGKGAVVEYLVSKKGFSHYSARTIILNTMDLEHIPHTKENMRTVANNLRKEHGASYIIEGLYQMAREDSNAVLESVRTIGEAEFLKKQGAKIISVDADKKTRYERVANKGVQLDYMSFEDFQKIEDREMASSDPWDMNVFGVIQLADARITNNKSLEELYEQNDLALRSFATV
jgi:dephospho-CoA kinase